MKNYPNRLGVKKRSLRKRSRPETKIRQRFALVTFEELELRALLSADALLSGSAWYSTADVSLRCLMGSSLSRVNVSAAPAASPAQAASLVTTDSFTSDSSGASDQQATPLDVPPAAHALASVPVASPLVVGPATQLVVTVQPPSSVTSLTHFSATVSAEDALGQVVPSFVGSVTLDLGAGSPSGALLRSEAPLGTFGEGAQTLTFTSGVATFSNLLLDAGGTYTLHAITPAAAATLSSTDTNSFTVTPAMEFRLEAEDTSASHNPLPASGVPVGQNFDLAVFVHDVRTPVQALPGIFAAWLNVSYNSALASIVIPTSPPVTDLTPGIVFGPGFSLVPSGQLGTPGLIIDAGASMQTSPTSNAEQLLFRVVVHPTAAGPLTFQSLFDPAPPAAGHDSLISHPTFALAESEIQFDPLTVTVALFGPPTVTPATTNSNLQTTAGLVIAPAAADGTMATNYLITNITGGTLFKNDGVTAITNGSMISIADGTAGLKFTPTTGFVGQGSFKVQESPDGIAADASGAIATAAITVNQVVLTGPPTVTPASTTANLQTTSGLVIAPAAVDGILVTNYLITNITHGTLFLHDGVTAVTNGSMITAAQGSAGLTFNPTTGFIGQGSFTVKQSPDAIVADASGATATATISVNLTGPPTVTTTSVTQNHQTTSGLVITPAVVDGTSVTNYLITNITGGTLFQNDGVTAISNGSMITVAQGSLGLRFTPTINFVGQGSFKVQESPDGTAADASGAIATASITVNQGPLVGPPAITSASANENAQTTFGLVITPAAADATVVTNYLITGITHGTLFQNDGVTAISNGSMITIAQGTAGLKFTPATNFVGQGSFTVQESTDSVVADASGATAVASITLNPAVLAGPPTVTTASVAENHQTTSGLVISPAAADGSLVTNYLITGITNGTLFQHDGSTAITNGSVITAAQGTAGLKFTPTTNFVGQGSFTIKQSPDGNAADASGTTAVASITVSPAVLTGPPAVTTASTTVSHQTTSGLVITPAAVDGTVVTNYLITGITNGTLFQNDGVTAITSGSMITASQGSTGLKFTPTTGFVGHGSFTIQESPDSNVSDATGTTATASIAVNLTGPPTVTTSNAIENAQTSFGLVITPAVADGTLVTNYLITGITHGTLFQNDGVTAISNGSMITLAQGTAGLKFTPTTNFVGQGSFTIQQSPDGIAADASGATAVAAITVNPAVLTGPPAVTTSSVTENHQTTSGLVISPAAADGTLVTNYLITSITNGTLFQNDGVTPITSGSMITAAQGTAGLKFTPTTNFVGQGSFIIKESPDGNVSDASGTTATAAITVNPAVLTGPPTVTASSTAVNHQTTVGLVISPAAADGTLVTNYLITGITNGTLFQHDGVAAITNGSMITAAQGTAGLRFTPTTSFVGQGSFTIKESPDGNVADASGTTATAAITVSLAGPPVVTSASTTVNQQTTSGLVVTPAAADAGGVAGYQVTNITGGTLFLSDGVTPIANSAFITLSQAAQLKFTPTTDSTANGSFKLQETTTGTAAGLSGAIAPATVIVVPANSTFSGTVFVDVDHVAAKNGGQFSGQQPLDGAVVLLFKIDDTGQPVGTPQSFTIGDPGVPDGTYSFTVTTAGTYNLIFIPPEIFTTGTVVPGSAGGDKQPEQDGGFPITTHLVGGGQTLTGYNFFVPGLKSSAVGYGALVGSALASASQPQAAAAAHAASPAASNASTVSPLAAPSASPAAAVDNSGPITQSGDTVTVHGTAGDDNFQFVAGTVNTVTINGITRQFGAGATNFIFDGGGGNDTARMTGSSGNDVAALGLGSGTLTGTGYKVVVSNVKSLNVSGGGGHDTATLQDTALNDYLQASGDQVTLSNESALATSIAAFAQVQANSTHGGIDKAHVGAVDFTLAKQGNWLSV